MADKLGSYISKLMTTILDKEQDEFVIELALSELKRLNIDIESFVVKHEQDDSKEVEKTVKQLLQEDVKDESN
jgi:arginyl-tRNA synthetase